MKTITKISTQKRQGRYNVDLNGKFAFGLAESTIAKFGLVKDRELTDEIIEEILKADKVAIAYNKAINFIGSRLRSIKQVEDKLKTFDIDPTTISETINILKNQKYLDDDQFAKSYLTTQLNTSDKGISKIRFQLIQDGIDGQTTDQLLEQVSEEEWQELANNLATKLSKKNQRQSVNAKKSSIYQTMMTKGFKTNQIEIAIENLQLENNRDADASKLQRLIESKYDNYQKYENQANYRLKQYLYSKGFLIEDIDRALDIFLNTKK